MTTWILTTGNSDVMLNNQDQWLYLCDPIYEQVKNVPIGRIPVLYNRFLRFIFIKSFPRLN